MENKLVIKNEICKYFKIAGYQLRSENALLLVEKVEQLSKVERREYLGKILANFQNQQNIVANSIEKQNIINALRDTSEEGYTEESETIFSVINAFDVPFYLFDKDLKKFIVKRGNKKLMAPPSSRSEYIRNRYTLLLQRILRHDLFAPNVNENIRSSGNESRKFVLKLAENLQSASTVMEVVMLGLLARSKEGKFCLEDPTGAITIDLRETIFHSGLYMEGSFMLAEGIYNDGVLKVKGLGFPPIEQAASSRAFFGAQNYWGGSSTTLLKYSKKLAEYEVLNVGASFIFLSDCWLDDPAVMSKLKKLFHGFDESAPIAIVLMGPFLKNKQNPKLLRTKFSQLADIIDSTVGIKNNTDIILVPDIQDPTSANILPRPPLPTFLVQDLMKKTKRVVLATNPCRLQYCTQQIVICRYDLLRKMCRNTIRFPDDGKLVDHFVRTLLCQGTLTPFTQLTLPTFWDFDAALSLYPLPDLIILGDNSTDFQRTQSECTIVNTGSFPKSKFSFKLYSPHNRTVEDSQIPDGDDDEAAEK